MVCCVLQAEDGIRDLVRSRGLGDVYKRQDPRRPGDRVGHGRPADEDRHTSGGAAPDDVLRGAALEHNAVDADVEDEGGQGQPGAEPVDQQSHCLLYTSDAADERSSVDLGGRRIIKKKKR